MIGYNPFMAINYACNSAFTVFISRMFGSFYKTLPANKQNIVLELNVRTVEIITVSILIVTSGALWVGLFEDKLPFNFTMAVIFTQSFMGSSCASMGLIAAVSFIKVLITANFSFIHNQDQGRLSKLVLISVLTVIGLIYSSLAGYYLSTGIVAGRAMSHLTRHKKKVQGTNYPGWVTLVLLVLFSLVSASCKLYLKWFAKKRPTNPSIAIGERRVKAKEEASSHGLTFNRIIGGAILMSLFFLSAMIELTAIASDIDATIPVASMVISFTILPFLMSLTVVIFVYDDNFKEFLRMRSTQWSLKLKEAKVSRQLLTAWRALRRFRNKRRAQVQHQLMV